MVGSSGVRLTGAGEGRWLAYIATLRGRTFWRIPGRGAGSWRGRCGGNEKKAAQVSSRATFTDNTRTSFYLLLGTALVNPAYNNE